MTHYINNCSEILTHFNHFDVSFDYIGDQKVMFVRFLNLFGSYSCTNKDCFNTSKAYIIMILHLIGR